MGVTISCPCGRVYPVTNGRATCPVCGRIYVVMVRVVSSRDDADLAMDT